MANHLEELCQSLEAYEFDGSDDVLDRKELLEDIVNTLSDIKQLVINSADDRYVQANILFHSDHKENIPKDLLTSAAKEVLGSGAYVEIKNNLIQEIDNISGSIENIVFDDTEDSSFSDRFSELKDSISGFTDNLLHHTSILSNDGIWDRISAFNENSISDKLQLVPPKIKEEIADSYTAETDSRQKFFFERNENGEIKVIGQGVQYENATHSNAFGINGFGEFVNQPKNGLTPKDFENYLHNLNLLNGGVGENATIGEINPFYLNQEERFSLINAFVIKGLGDEDTRKYVELSPNDISAMEHFAKCEAHAFGYEVLERDQLIDRIDQSFEKIGIESPLSNKNDHADTPIDIEGYHAAEGSVKAPGSLIDKNTYVKTYDGTNDSVKSAAADVHGYSILWKFTGNEKIDEHIKIRNDYITRTGPYPQYRKSLRFNYHEMRAVTMAFKEKLPVNGRIPDFRDVLTAYDHFRSCNVIELAVDSLILGVFRLLEKRPEDKIEGKPADMDKQPQDTDVPMENISEKPSPDLEAEPTKELIDMPEEIDPEKNSITESDSSTNTENDLDREENTPEDTEKKDNMESRSDTIDSESVAEEEAKDKDSDELISEENLASVDELPESYPSDLENSSEKKPEDMEITSNKVAFINDQKNDEENEVDGDEIDSEDTVYSDNESVGSNLFAEAFARMKDKDDVKADVVVVTDAPENINREIPQEFNIDILKDIGNPDINEKDQEKHLGEDDNTDKDGDKDSVDRKTDKNDDRDAADKKTDNNGVNNDKEMDSEKKADIVSEIASAFSNVAWDSRTDARDFLDQKIEAERNDVSIRDVLDEGPEDLKEKIADAIVSEIESDIHGEDIIEKYADLISAIIDITGDPEFLSLVEAEANEEKQEVFNQIAEKISETEADSFTDMDLLDNLALNLSILENDIFEDVTEIIDSGIDQGIEQGADYGMEVNADMDTELAINLEIDSVVEPDVENGAIENALDDNCYAQINPESISDIENQTDEKIYESHNFTSNDLVNPKVIESETSGELFYSDPFDNSDL